MHDEATERHAALTRRAERTASRLGILGSLALHVALAVGLLAAPPLPQMDFELVLPSEIDVGFVDGQLEETPEPEPAPAATPTPPEEPSSVTQRDPPEPLEPTKPDAPAPDAGAQQEPPPDAGAEPVDPKPKGPPLLSAFAPKGAQLSLRLDMAAVRASPLSEDVRGLLLNAPDFRAVLDDSGIDPVRDLERLYLASPDLRRHNLVIAGEHQGATDLARRAIESLALARGLPAPVRERHGVLTAPWHDRDETQRVLALFTRAQFVITREDDLQRVLSVARAVARKHKSAPSAAASESDALLSLDPGVVAKLEVDDVRRFARGNLRGIPQTLEVTAQLQTDGGVSVQLLGNLETEEAAEQALSYWRAARDRFAAHPLVALAGMRAPLLATEISREGRTLQVLAQLSQVQARMLLGFARSSIAPPPPPLPIGDKPTAQDLSPHPPDASLAK